MRGVLQILRCGSMLLVLAGTLAACQNVTQVQNRGYVETKVIDEEVKVGATTKDEVRRLLGSPSTQSAYPPETWYYIARERETIGFLSPKLTGQDVARIEFDEFGRVSKLEHYGMDAAQEMDYVERKTPTEGRSLGFFEQLLGNLGRFNAPRDATQARQ